MYKSLVRPLLFQLAPEQAHHFSLHALKLACSVPGIHLLLRELFELKHPELKREVAGITFPNPVGLAAGFDKNAECYRELFAFGFGFIEVGTVTPLPQPGNPQPRLFRLPHDQSLVNRLGFNNHGLDAVVKNLKNRNPGMIIGGNIGKNKDTPNQKASDDYVKGFEALYDVVDYFTINVSSPNTPNLRELQEKVPLTSLLQAVQRKNVSNKPIFLKIAPDITQPQLEDIAEIVETTDIHGLVATNTTIERKNMDTPAGKVREIGAGGLSGKALRSRATETIRNLRKVLPPDFPIIGVGGIFTPEDALEKMEAGASLIQLYTGFVYEGPSIVNKINSGILSQQKVTN